EWITKQTNFTISSLFPFTTVKGEKVHFFPKPFLKPNTEGAEVRTEDAKIFKKVKYIDTSILEAYLQFLPQKSDTNLVKGSYQTRYDIDKDFIQTDVVPRIRKPRRDDEDADPFYIERIYFKEGSGLFCLVQFDTLEVKQQVLSALAYLAETGLGTDRNVGHGLFDFTIGDISLTLPSSSDWSVNLSLFCPENQQQLSEMLDERARYEIIRRGGWMSEPYNTYRKRSVYMFKEGCLFHTTSSPKGKTEDLQPDNALLPSKVTHPVWRVGKALFLPVKLP
ncbi:MAG: type III-A CRISPR-associated RAMP protein Csm4, partial [Runella sp.]